ncbi:hypothetical protein BN1723_019062, partial [Verticillium longisporum]
VVLVNNQAFTPQLNDKLVSLFLDLKKGCKIVSLKSFLYDQGVRSINDVASNILQVEDHTYPEGHFKKGETIRVRAIGLHDSKDHRFLAFSHRSYNSVLEFTAKASDIEADELKPLSLEYLQVGSTHVAFVNNASRNGLWTNISPVVRGRINAMDVSDDTSKMNDVINNFPIGTALKVRVIAVDAKRGVLDLSARSDSSAAVTWDSIKPNQVLAGCVVKVNERQIMVKL